MSFFRFVERKPLPGLLPCAYVDSSFFFSALIVNDLCHAELLDVRVPSGYWLLLRILPHLPPGGLRARRGIKTRRPLLIAQYSSPKVGVYNKCREADLPQTNPQAP